MEEVRQKVEAYIHDHKVSQVHVCQIKDEDYSSDAFALTSKLLSQNPEYYTVWNYRRRILLDAIAKEQSNPEPSEDAQSGRPAELTSVQHEISLLLKEDLNFLIPLLRQFAKCYWIWNHRAWLLQQVSEHLPTSSAIALWKEEMGLVSKMLSYDSRNFHAWQYRRTVVGSLEELSRKELQKQTQPRSEGEEGAQAGETQAEAGKLDEAQVVQQASLAEQEFEYTTKMIRTNLSNFSAWHNRSQLIPRLLAERNADDTARRRLLDQEFDLITQALYTDPYDQSLWFYHQYLMTTLSPKCPARWQIVKDMNNGDRVEYFETQMEMLKDMLDGTDDCKWIYQALLTTAQEYLEVESGNKAFSTAEMEEWLSQLERLDPLRKKRWEDWRKNLGL